jgi:hypothetical protein
MTQPDAASDTAAIQSLVDELDESTAADSRVLIEMMRGISGHEPRVWNVGTIGFDTYHYRYDSGREGDSHCLAFYPRRGKITVYLMDGTAQHSALLADLGTHTTSRVCVYLKRLSDVSLPVLEQVLRESYAALKAGDGQVRRVE